MLNNPNTKERILDIAEHFIMSKGFNGFSYKNIATELNVKNAAIHYHFPSKKDLGVAVIQRAQTRFKVWNEMIGHQDSSPLDMLMAVLEMFVGYANSDEYVCLGGSLETDFNTFPKEMQNEIRLFAAEMLNYMRNVLETGRETGVFTFSDSPEDKAIFILSTLQGALQMDRVSDKNILHRVIDRIKVDLRI